jgi:hypothetical protein
MRVICKRGEEEKNVADRIIDEQLLIAGRSKRGGWNRAQIEMLGVPWPLRQGWKEALLARRVPISETDAAIFVNLRDAKQRGQSRALRKLLTARHPRVVPLVDDVARAIYYAHWRSPSPAWEAASKEMQAWVHRQAESAIAVVAAAKEARR